MKDFDNPKYYFNRELSWLKFNQRVLQESIDRSNPLMEKLRASVDAYEHIAAREFYKLPSYEDILFNI